MDGEFLLWLARYFGLLALIFVPLAIFAKVVPRLQQRKPRLVYWLCRVLAVGMMLFGIEGLAQDWLTHVATLQSLSVTLPCLMSAALLWHSSDDLKAHLASPDRKSQRR